MFHFLHIGKTGGSAIKHVLEALPPRPDLRIHTHWDRLDDVPPGEKAFFVVRHPRSRFVSGFNSRLRQGRPRYDTRWTPDEVEIFARFPTANALAEALSSADSDTRSAAETAIQTIGHTALKLSFWFGSVEDLQARRSDIAFVGHLPTLDADFARLRTILGLPPEAALPGDPVAAHRTPEGFETDLSELGAANIDRWYAEDFAIYEACLRIRAEILGAE